MNSQAKFKKLDSTTIVDEATNEVYAKENVNYYMAKFRPKIKDKFMLTYQDSLYELAKDKALPRTSFSVLIYLISLMDFDNTISINQRDIAEDLETSQQVVSRAVKILEQRSYIKIFPNRGQVNTYLICPALCEKGDHRTRKEVERMWDKHSQKK
jgi:hypothetical protein